MHFFESEEKKRARLEREAAEQEAKRIAAEEQNRKLEAIDRIVISTGPINNNYNILQAICSVSTKEITPGLFSGRTTVDQDDIERLYSMTVKKLKENAYRVGADAVIHCKFDLDQVASVSGNERDTKTTFYATIFCTGTAVQFI